MEEINTGRECMPYGMTWESLFNVTEQRLADQRQSILNKK